MLLHLLLPCPPPPLSTLLPPVALLFLQHLRVKITSELFHSPRLRRALPRDLIHIRQRAHELASIRRQDVGRRRRRLHGQG